MSNEPVTTRPGKDSAEKGLAGSPRDPVTDQVRPIDGPMDRAGTEAGEEAGMSNKPIPIPNDDPEVGLTTPVED
jgi:hypothetical protein